MNDVASVAQVVSQVVYLLLALQAARLWRRHRNASAAWVAATFGALGLAVLVGLVAGEDPPLVVTKITVLLIGAYPYLLYRFARSLRSAPRWLDLTAGALTGAVLVSTLVTPRFPEPGDANPAWFTAYLILFLGTWLGLQTVVGAWLWRAGRGQPMVVRRRMQLLAVASVGLGLYLVASVTAGDRGAASAIVAAFGPLIGLLFLTGFSPPGMLKAAWREREEREVYGIAIRALGSLEESEHLVDRIVPHIRSVVGASRLAVFKNGEHVHGDGEGDLVFPEDDEREVVRIDVGAVQVVARLSTYAPLFGEEEVRLLRRLALLVQLAMDRAESFEREAEARLELEAANAELEAFVYSASHDLKNPLIAMLGYLDLLEREYADELDGDGQWYLERMTSNGLFMRDLIQDLLELSRVGRMDTEPGRVDLNELVSDISTELENAHPHVTVDVAGDLPDLWMNVTRLRQLLANLLQNAAVHGGRDQLHVTISARKLPGGGVLLEVSDDGVGVPPDYRERIFGVFERLEGEGEGTGIGLAICQKIVESVGGTIAIEDNEPGARFIIRLPESGMPDVSPSRAADDVLDLTDAPPDSPRDPFPDPTLDPPGGAGQRRIS